MTRKLNIAVLAAGAAGMLCGSCIRDNTLTLALQRQGHDAIMVPLYTPVKVDGERAVRGSGPVFYGGINAYLQNASWLFRHTPRFVDWLLDRPGILKAAGNLGAGTPPAKLAGMTKAMVMGARGKMGKELKRLVRMLRTMKPDVISLPNLMFIGVAETLKEELKVPLVVELTGEDVFFEAMREEDQRELRDLIRQSVPYCAGFVATCKTYAAKMAAYLDLPVERITTIYPGVPAEMIGGAGSEKKLPMRVGHLARIDPVKGLDLAHGAVDRAREMGVAVELHYAGWEGGHMKKWHEQVRKAAKTPGTYHGEVDFAGKVSLMDSLTMLIAPAPLVEAKGMYVLEAMARGVPIIAANQGAFTETVGEAGLLVEPKNVEAFAAAIAELAGDEARRRAMSEAGRRQVAARFTDRLMAEESAAFYSTLL